MQPHSLILPAGQCTQTFNVHATRLLYDTLLERHVTMYIYRRSTILDQQALNFTLYQRVVLCIIAARVRFARTF